MDKLCTVFNSMQFIYPTLDITHFAYLTKSILCGSITYMEEKTARNFDLFLAKLGLPPYTRVHTYKELCEKHNLSRHFVERKINIYKLKYPALWQKRQKK